MTGPVGVASLECSYGKKRITINKAELTDRNPRTQTRWFKEVRKDMKEMEIDGEEAERREDFREKIRGFKGFQEKEKKKTGEKWTGKKEGNNMEEK